MKSQISNSSRPKRTPTAAEKTAVLDAVFTPLDARSSRRQEALKSLAPGDRASAPPAINTHLQVGASTARARKTVSTVLSVSTWTPISDALPDDEITVLAWTPDGTFEYEIAYHEDGKWFDQTGCLELEVTHWQHLPAPPQ